jgi:hypothetical protein
MKQILYITIFFFLLLLPSYCKLTENIFVQIKLENDKDKPWDNLIFGIAPDATYKMDSIYNEFEIPDIPLPSDIFYAVMLTKDENEGKDLWSYRSIFGPSEDSIKFERTYRFKVFYGTGSYVRMSWQKLPKYIDSVIISDPYETWFKVNMANTNQATNNEILVDQFIVKAYYNIDIQSVEEVSENDILFFPNPAKDYLKIISKKEIKFIQICNFLGIQLSLFYDNANSLLNIANLPNGIYFIKMQTIDGEEINKKLIIHK